MPSIIDFKQKFYGGTRQNRFIVEGVIPGNGQISRYHVQRTQIPDISTLPIEYNYFGRKAYYPGEKSYNIWSMIFVDDTNLIGDHWKKFTNWQNTINAHTTNISFEIGSQADYKAYNWRVKQLNLDGEEDKPLKTFVMHGCWPKTVGDLNLSMQSRDKLVEMKVDFVFDWIEIVNVTS
jgi:hypothetical protein